ncbi:hypothetical protein FEM54_25385 [Pseudomonas edaphica]|uniref:Uncharacterized protein n=2 Tax=Pseudomonas TaxID=286 RepID=A0ABS9GV35_9PSED|nr:MULTISPECIES: hypothetical protein [Pseudomonas]MBD8094833.1 hypothetical protein [Pseudomonas fluorescens]MBD8720153.1 hypothetical protein [Pseudomonas fluorescens]MCF5143939.1 hypothetical protein [Pseudomonas sp. PA-6-3C]MCF5150328.1 hypothetical protein [Pseudomonas sp. PA-6-3F]MCF5162132.1 hypothetical protein [Pseudomonas sp. PA-6-2E]
MSAFEFLTPGSVGSLRFGMPREQARAILGKAFETFKKTAESMNTTDAYDVQRLHLYYDETDQLKGVEFFQGSQFSWKGEILVGMTCDDLKKTLRLHEVAFLSDNAGIDAKALGMSFYIPDIYDEGDNAIVKCLYLDLSVADSKGGYGL